MTLIHAGANPGLKHRDGKTALDIAENKTFGVSQSAILTGAAS